MPRPSRLASARLALAGACFCSQCGAPAHRWRCAPLGGVFVRGVRLFRHTLSGATRPLAGPRARQVLYALTAGVAGYVSAVSYRIMGGTNWVRNVLLTTALFCGPLLAMFSFLNTVAIVYRTTTALPFGTIVIILVIWALITFPLTVLGGIAGKNSKARALPAPLQDPGLAGKRGPC